MKRTIRVGTKSRYCLACGPKEVSSCNHICACEVFMECEIHGNLFAEVDRKIIQIMPADDWWVVEECAIADDDGVQGVIKSPLVAWALVEEHDDSTNVVGLRTSWDQAPQLVDIVPSKFMYVKSLRDEQEFYVHPAGIREVESKSSELSHV